MICCNVVLIIFHIWCRKFFVCDFPKTYTNFIVPGSESAQLSKMDALTPVLEQQTQIT